MSDRQSQDAGEGSTLIQAGGSVMIGQHAGPHSTNIQGQTVNMGITVSEARQIALDVFEANALELAGIARDLFEARGRDFIERYVENCSSGNLQLSIPSVIPICRSPYIRHNGNMPERVTRTFQMCLSTYWWIERLNRTEH